jgi:pyochelin biosynthesis protein PchC
MEDGLNMPESGGNWVRHFHPSATAFSRLICFPHAGGSASYFYPVSAALSPNIEVLAVQYPGRQDRRNEKNIEDIGELADRAFDAVMPWCKGPVAFFGHSMGAIVAFEVARRLERKAGITPLALIVSGRRGPATQRTENVHLLGDDGIAAEMRRLSGTNAALLDEQELADMILLATRSDYKAIETYRYQPGVKLSCPILALTGEDDPLTTRIEVEDWAQHTSREFALSAYPGGHFYLNDQPAEIIGKIFDYLTSLQAGANGGRPGSVIPNGE